LFALIDSKYGVGDGSTTFNVPDFQGSNSFPRGATDDAGRGTTGGESTHTLSIAEMSSHDHGYTKPKTSNSGSGANYGGVEGGTTGATGGGGSHENKPPFVDVHFIIKAL